MTVGGFPLHCKVAVVTGAGSGINFAFAQQAVHQGAKVIIADLKVLNDAEKFIESHKEQIIFAKCDVTKRADLESLSKISDDKFGTVPDVWIAGAGVFEPGWSNFWDDTEDDGYKQVDINVNHPMKLSRIAIRALLKANKKGVILVVASLAGYQGAFAAPLYCATKHACVGFVRSLADLDRLENIKVVLIAPGFVRTPLWTDHPEKMKQFGYTLENTITPETVARGMIELVQDGNYGGGDCMEISSSGTRLLGVWNVEAPPAEGTSVSQDVIELNYRPIVDLLKSERTRS